MITSMLARWLVEVETKCLRSGIVFLNLGSAYPNARIALQEKFSQRLTVDHYLSANRDCFEAGIVMIDDFERLSDQDGFQLGKFRERVVSDQLSGNHFIFLSRVPRMTYPRPPGSEILYDAKIVNPPYYSCGDSPSEAGFGTEVLENGFTQKHVVEETCRELGAAACAELDELVFENLTGGPLVLNQASQPLEEALLSSGLAVRLTDRLDWTFTDAVSVLREALRVVFADFREPPMDFVAVADNCWQIEQLIKQSLRARSIAVWAEHWERELLDVDAQRDVLSRATRMGNSAAIDIRDLRNPLEWLSLAEVFELIRVSEIGSLGLPDDLWLKLETEILPIKGRVERSHLTRRSDRTLSRRWLETLKQRLSRTGSRGIEEALSSSTSTQRALLERLRAALSENPDFRGDAEKDFMSIVISTLRFVAHALDSRPDYTRPFDERAKAPLEKALQLAFKTALDMSELAGRCMAEVSDIGGGRADIVLYFDGGDRYVTEVKRDFRTVTETEVDGAYLSQTVAYQSSSVGLGQLLILDLSNARPVELERLDRSVWVVHRRADDGSVIFSTVVFVVRGNRPGPSSRNT